MTGSFYAAYLTGSVGNSLALFFIGNGILSGVDIGGVSYNGRYTVCENGDFDGVVEFSIPPNTMLITGETGKSLNPTKIEMQFTLPVGFEDGRIVPLATPTGALNGRFEKLRDV